MLLLLLLLLSRDLGRMILRGSLAVGRSVSLTEERGHDRMSYLLILCSVHRGREECGEDRRRCDELNDGDVRFSGKGRCRRNMRTLFGGLNLEVREEVFAKMWTLIQALDLFCFLFFIFFFGGTKERLEDHICYFTLLRIGNPGRVESAER